MEYTVRIDKKKHNVQFERPGDWGSEFEAKVDKKDYHVMVRATHADGSLKTVQINNRVYPVEIERQGDGLPSRVTLKGIPYDLQIERVASTRFRPETSSKTVSGEARARLPGTILEILVKPGEKVEKGQTVLILEAMKMENSVLAPKEGKLKTLEVKAGDLVSKEQFLFEVE